MQIKMLVSDIDGTLVSDDRTISEKNIQYIRKSIDKGLIFVLATGRMLPSAQEIKNIIDRDITIIATNGGLTFQEDKLTRTESIDFETLKKIHQRKLSKELDLFYYGQSSFYMTKKAKKSFLQVYRNPRFKHEQKIITDIGELEGKNIYKAFYYSTERKFLDNLKTDLADLKNVNITSSHHTNVEVTATNATKGMAVEDLARSLGLDMDDVMAIGDNHNDLSMITKAGLGVAVDNASDLIKSQADIVTVSNNQDALAQVLEDYYFV